MIYNPSRGQGGKTGKGICGIGIFSDIEGSGIEKENDKSKSGRDNDGKGICGIGRDKLIEGSGIEKENDKSKSGRDNDGKGICGIGRDKLIEGSLIDGKPKLHRDAITQISQGLVQLLASMA